MRRRERKELEELLLGDVQVSDELLQPAKKELQCHAATATQEQPRKTKLSLTLRLSVIAMCACLVVCCVVLPIVWTRAPKNHSGNAYLWSELTETPIKSVAAYSDRYELQLLQTLAQERCAWVYRNAFGDDIAIRETSVYRGVDVEWLIVLDAEDRISEWNRFDNYTDRWTICGTNVFYGQTDGKAEAKFLYDARTYYCHTESADINVLRELLESMLL